MTNASRLRLLCAAAIALSTAACAQGVSPPSQAPAPLNANAVAQGAGLRLSLNFAQAVQVLPEEVTAVKVHLTVRDKTYDQEFSRDQAGRNLDFSNLPAGDGLVTIEAFAGDTKVGEGAQGIPLWLGRRTFVQITVALDSSGHTNLITFSPIGFVPDGTAESQTPMPTEPPYQSGTLSAVVTLIQGGTAPAQSAFRTSVVDLNASPYYAPTATGSQWVYSLASGYGPLMQYVVTALDSTGQASYQFSSGGGMQAPLSAQETLLQARGDFEVLPPEQVILFDGTMKMATHVCYSPLHQTMFNAQFVEAWLVPGFGLVRQRFISTMLIDDNTRTQRSVYELNLIGFNRDAVPVTSFPNQNIPSPYPSQSMASPYPSQSPYQTVPPVSPVPEMSAPPVPSPTPTPSL